MGVIQAVLQALGISHNQQGRYYVYELCDPRYDPPKVFYVGSGVGSRLFAHENETRTILKSGHLMSLKHKHKVIIEIWDAGKQVQYVVPFRSDSRCDAYQVEERYIRELGIEHLTNETYGWSTQAIRKCRQAERQEGRQWALR